MISLKFVLNENEWSSDIEISEDHNFSKEEAMSILHASRVSKNCFIDNANFISEYFDSETMKGIISSVLRRINFDIENDDQHTLIPTLINTYDNNRRND